MAYIWNKAPNYQPSSLATIKWRLPILPEEVRFVVCYQVAFKPSDCKQDTELDTEKKIVPKKEPKFQNIQSLMFH